MHAGIQVGFGELDYSEVEGSGGVNVVIQKQNQNFGDLVFTLKTLPFSKVTKRPGDIVLPDAAERKSEHNCYRIADYTVCTCTNKLFSTLQKEKMGEEILRKQYKRL